MNNQKRRVVVTGIGLVSPLGNDTIKFWDSLISLSNIFVPTSINTNPLPTILGAEVGCPIPNKHDVVFERANRYCKLAVIAAENAIKDANLVASISNRNDIAVIGATAFGSPVIQNLADYLDPIKAQYAYFHSPAGLINIRNKIKGPSFTICSGEASGSSAVCWGKSFIQSGRCNVAIVGATEVLSRNNYLHYASLSELSPNNTAKEQCIPFESNRNGFVLAEGSAYLVLEEMTHALNRNVTIYGEIAGCGSMNETSSDMGVSSKNEDLFIAPMELAIKDCRLSFSEINLIYAAANGSNNLDYSEGKSILSLIEKTHSKVKVSSIKSIAGEAMSAGSILSIVAALLSIKNGVVIPIVNFSNCDKKLPGLPLVVNTIIKNNDLINVLCNASSYGGIKTSIVIRKV